MRSITISGIGAVLAAALLFTTAFKSISPKKNAVNVSDKGFAVIELFTSEGCSSCPPADELVGKVQKESGDKPVYILAFHVDYWNRLGWKDIFSSADYSQRQNQYAKWLNLSSVYTPQIVVNGKTEFVGSEEGTLRSAIKANLQKSAKNQLALSDLKFKNSDASLQYRLRNKPANSSLLVALIERTATSKVLRGENGGRTLSHAQIVNKLQTIPLKDVSGSVSIALPHDFSAQNYEVIAFVQNNNNGEITAADKVSFQGDTATDMPSVKTSR